MFITMNKLVKGIKTALDTESENIALRKKIKELREEPARLNGEIEDLKLQKDLEEKKLKHLLKMKEEKDALTNDRARVKLESEFNTKEMEQMKSYHDKVLELMENNKKEMQAIHQSILKRLPDVNMRIVDKHETK